MDGRHKIHGELEWKPEYDTMLEEIASTDSIDISKWPLVRDIIKHKLNENIVMFLSGDVKKEYSRSTVQAAPCPGGLKLPPFPPRQRNDTNPYEAPKNTLTGKEAADFQREINTQIDGFDKSPPFTIQRVCEFVLRPTEHYKYLGKYLRAVEKSLLVTSTWDAFPPTTDSATNQTGVSRVPLGAPTLSTPTIPIFSPIPFLHEDARRSSSRSPPPSPLVLPTVAIGGTATATPLAGAEGAEQKALGLVDELDDPSPGHLSEHPQPLSATTTVPDPKPLFSLHSRFVKVKTEPEEGPQNKPESGSGSEVSAAQEEAKS